MNQKSIIRISALALMLVVMSAFVFALTPVSAEYEDVEHSKDITISEVPEVEEVVGSLRINKVDQFGQPVEAVEFSLTSTRGEELVFVGTTDENGSLVFEDLPVGFYQLEETSTPEGYLNIDEVMTIVITKKTTDQEITVVNEKVDIPVEPVEPEIPVEPETPEEFEVKLVKKDSVTEERLAGVAFDVYYEGELILSSVNTDDNGEIILAGIAGEYKFVEVQALEGYDFDEDNEYVVVVVDSDEEITVYNNPLEELEVNVPEEPEIEEPTPVEPEVEEPDKEIIDVLPATGHVSVSLIIGFVFTLMGLLLCAIGRKEEEVEEEVVLAFANYNKVFPKFEIERLAKDVSLVEFKNVIIGIYISNKNRFKRHMECRE